MFQEITHSNTVAKLLSQENITVINTNDSTASFNPKTRVLCIPFWTTKDKVIFNYMSGHESGHALYTPQDDYFERPEVSHITGSQKNAFHSFVNVLEDVRIERLMVKRYPGLRRDFIEANRLLFDREFYGCSDIDQINDQYTFIDRINLHFACGYELGVRFDAEEKEILGEIAEMETFDEVLAMALRLFQRRQDEKKNEAKQDSSSKTGQDSKEGESGESDGDSGRDQEDASAYESDDNIENVGEDKAAFEGDDEAENNEDTSQDGESEGGEGDIDGLDESGADSLGQQNGDVGEYDPNIEVEASQTEKALNDSLAQQGESKSILKYEQGFVDLRIPKVILDNIIVKQDEIVSEMSDCLAIAKRPQSSWRDEAFRNFVKNTKPTISYLVKEFEMKKRADEFSKTKTAKTGIIDPLKLCNYKFSDDIFLSTTIEPEGKNHGLIVYLDWSASIHGMLFDLYTQLYILMEFCRQTQIPFRVYAFSSRWYPEGEAIDGLDKIRIMNSGATAPDIDEFGLLELFTSESKNAVHNEMIKMMYTVSRDPWLMNHSRLRLSQTPLQHTFVVAPQIFSEFKAKYGLDRVNTFVLSDGFGQKIGTKANYEVDTLSCNKSDSTIKLTHELSGQTLTFSNVNLGSSFNARYIDYMLLSLHKKVTQSNTIGYFLYDKLTKGTIRQTVANFSFSEKFKTVMNEYQSTRTPRRLNWSTCEELIKIWKQEYKEKKFVEYNDVGYDSLFALLGANVRVDKNNVTDLPELSDTTKARLRSQFLKGRRGQINSKVILNKMIELIA